DQRAPVAQRLVDRRGDDIAEQLRVVGIDRLRVDLDLQDLAARGRGDLDRAAAGAGRDLLLRRLLLEPLKLLLHLHRLAEQLVRVDAAAHFSTSSASKVRFISSTISSSVAGCSSSSSSCSRSSPSENTSESLRPVTS